MPSSGSRLLPAPSPTSSESGDEPPTCLGDRCSEAHHLERRHPHSASPRLASFELTTEPDQYRVHYLRFVGARPPWLTRWSPR